MSNFCSKCGAELNYEGKCPNCDVIENAEPQYEVTGEPAAKTAGNLPLNKNILIAAGAAVAALIVILIIVIATSANAYKKPIDTMIDVSFKGKINKIEKLAPKAYWDYMEDEYDMNVKDIIEEFEDEDYFEDMMDELEEEYGKNVKVSYKVTDKEKLSKKDLDAIKDGLKDNYDIAKKSVKKGYEVEIEMTIKGRDDKDTEESTFNVVKIGGKWYLVSDGGSIMVDMW